MVVTTDKKTGAVMAPLTKSLMKITYPNGRVVYGYPIQQPKSLGAALLLKEVRARELWPQYLARLKGNDCHNPAGSPEGGQFCAEGESGGTETQTSAPYTHLNTQPKIQELLRRYEQRFNTAYGQNEAAAIIKDGKVTTVIGNKRDEITVNVARNTLNDSIFTHSHPDFKNATGGTFSRADLMFAISNKVQEMRAVASDRIYSMTLTRLGREIRVPSLVGGAYDQASKSAKREVYDAVRSYANAKDMVHAIGEKTFQKLSAYVKVTSWKR